MKSQIFLSLVLIGCPILETALGNPTNAVQSLGVRVFPVVTNGIVFIDGEYIPPPYSIRRDETAIILNERQYFIDDRWPLRPHVPPKPPTPPKERPKMPFGITAQTAFEDVRVSSYEEQMRLYLFDKFGEEKGIDMMVEVYKQMPFITDAKRIDSNSIRLWVIGRSNEVEFVVRQRNFQDWGAWMRVKSAEELIMSLEIKALRMVKALSDGRLVMNSGFPLSSGVECLFPIADALRNAGTETEFLERIPDSLRQRGILERDLKNFWKHREQAPVWEAWAKQIYEEDLEAHLSYEEGLVALDPFIRAASSGDGLLATLQVKRPRLFRRILGEDSKGNFNYSNGLFGEYELREFFKNRNSPEGWRPKPSSPPVTYTNAPSQGPDLDW